MVMLKQIYNVNKKLLTYALEHYNCIFILLIVIEAKTPNFKPMFRGGTREGGLGG